MKARVIAIVTVALGFLVPGAVAAQTVRAGVDVDALVPAAMQIADVVVPDRAEVPVRLLLAPTGAQAAALLLDVLVAPDARRANEALDWQIATVQGGVAEASRLGDRAFADDGFVAFVRDNVMVVIRRLAVSAGDARAFAAEIDRAISRMTAGATRASIRAQLPDPTAMRVGESARIAVPEGALGLLIGASGGVTARRTADGYIITRTGDGPPGLTAVVVDRRLRTSL